MLGELCEGVSRRGAFGATEERHVDVSDKIGDGLYADFKKTKKISGAMEMHTNTRGKEWRRSNAPDNGVGLIARRKTLRRFPSAEVPGHVHSQQIYTDL